MAEEAFSRKVYDTFASTRDCPRRQLALDLRFLSLVQVKNYPFQLSEFSFLRGKVEILCGNLPLYISSPGTINLSLPCC